MPDNKKPIERIVTKNKIYILIIAIILVILCIQNIIFIIPSIIVFIFTLIYTYWIDNKKTTEITQHIEELTFDIDSTAKKTLVNSPFPLVILETDGNIVWRSSTFVSEFGNIDIKNILINLSKEIKEELEKGIKAINKQLKIEKKDYKIIGEYIKNKQKGRKKKNEFLVALYFINNTENLELEKKYEDSKNCIGIISVDNYDETMKGITSEERPQVMVQIENIVQNWISETEGIAIKSERDIYICIFDQKW